MSERVDGWGTIKPLIREVLAGVEGIGRVHDKVRHSAFWAKFKAEFVHDGRVHAWEFTRGSMGNQFDDVSGRQVASCIFRRDHQVRIDGRYAVDDEADTEGTFQDLTDDVVTAFERDILLGGRLRIGTPPIIQLIEHQTYGGVLVHHSQILFTATERVGR